MIPTLKRSAVLAVSLCVGLLANFNRLSAQSTLYSPGLPPNTTTIPVEDGFISIANGNLHLDIPFATQKQRGGLAFPGGMVYDSSIWHGVDTGNGKQWMPTNVANSSSGWRFLPLASTSASWSNGSGTTKCSSSGSGYFQNYAFQWSDNLGTVHVFPIETTEVPNNIPGCVDGVITDTPTGSSYASDGSGYYAVVSSYNHLVIWDPKGTQVEDSLNGSPGPVIDANGNYWTYPSSADFGQDDLGRTLIQTSENGSNIIYYDVLTTNNQRARYTVTTETVPIKTNFLAQSIGADFTGSITAVQSIGLPDGSSYSFTYESGSYGELASMTLPHGGTVSFKYLSGDSGSRSGENVPPRYVSEYSGGGGTTTFYIHPNNCSSNPVPCPTQDTRVTRNGSTTDYLYTLVPAAGNAYFNTQITTYTGDQTTTALSTVVKGYNSGTACPAYYCSPSNPNSDPFSRTMWLLVKSVKTTLNDVGLSSYTLYNAYASPGTGVPTDVQKWDYLPSSSTFPPSTAPTRRVLTTIGEYVNGSPFPSETDTYGSGTLLSKETFSYDEPAYMSTSTGITHHEVVPGPHGNLTTLAQWLNTNSSTLSTHFYHDDTGALLKVVDPNNNLTSFSYDPTDTFVVKTTHPVVGSVQLNSQNTYDFSSGQVLTATAVNGQTTRSTYDSLGRPYQTTYPDGRVATTTYPSPNEIDTSDLQASGISVASKRVVDSFGRFSSASTGSISTETTYDSQGRLNCVTAPHATASSSTDGSTCHGYDNYDRLNKTTQPDLNVVGVTYTGNKVTTTDELGHRSMSTYDAFGDVSSLTEPDLTGALNWVTAYQYTGLGQLSRIDQEGGTTDQTQWRTRTFVYDSLGRVTSRTSPESGTEGFTYDNNGNLLTSTDARNIAVTFTYDPLNRMHTRTVPSDGTYTYTYDAQDSSGDPYGKGALTSANNGANVGFYLTHDTMGRLASQKYCLPSDCSYTQAMLAGYDYHGNVTSLTYPDGRNVQMTYDINDRIAGETYVAWNGTAVNTPYFSNAVYLPPGQLSAAKYGTSIQLSAGFSNRQVISSLGYAFGTQSLISKSYIWDKNAANLLSIADAASGTSRSFTYDPLNRLASATNTSGPAFTETYTPDAWGNLKQSGNFNFTQAIGSNNRIAATGYTYDSAGNLTVDGLGNTYQYNGDGKLSSSNAATYTYDPFGQRVRNTQSSASTEYYFFGGKLMATRDPSSGVWMDYIFAGDRLIAESRGALTATAAFRIDDHLDSLETIAAIGPLLVPNTGAPPVTTNDYSPYGQIITLAGTDRIMFTDHERDTENNTDHTQYRQYASVQGRWLSPDPYSGSYNLFDPQSFNRYAYLSNRPNNAVDPNGLMGDGVSSNDGGGGDGGWIGIIIGGLIDYFSSLGGGGVDPRNPGYPNSPSSPSATTDSTGQPDWNGPILNEQLGLSPNLARRLGRGSLLGAFGIYSTTCEFGACGRGLPFQNGQPQWEVDNRPLKNLPLADLFEIYHYYFYNRATGEAIGLGTTGGVTSMFCASPGKWERQEGQGRLEFQIPDSLQGCVDSRLHRDLQKSAPDYKFFNSLATTSGENCFGYVADVLSGCKL